MASDNISSGLKVVDFASFIAAPAAAVVLSDFGADVIKVEPPSGDTWRILRELGFGAKDIDALRASRAVPKAKERTA
jgi:crotonobetainyl-CoA:carnitine CoA-transferase CaiB-like acyl-CoA transferase